MATDVNAPLTLKKAQRSTAYFKLGMAAPSGGGKTAGSLLVAFGLMKEKYPKLSDEELWAKIAIIDTENGSGELYVGSIIGNQKIGEYNAITLSPPFGADKYTTAIDLCEKSGMEVAIIDSTTHLWSGAGGLLEQQGHAAKRSGNSYTAWREITPKHNRFVEKMLQTPMHVIATMRAKQEYVQEKNQSTGKSSIRKLGMEPEQRKGMEYEFTTFFSINAEHEAFGSKDRTTLFDQKTFKITPQVGRDVMKWLQTSVSDAPVVVAQSHVASPESAAKTVKSEIIEMCKGLGGSSNEVLMATLKKYVKSGNPNEITDTAKLTNLRSELVDLQKQETK